MTTTTAPEFTLTSTAPVWNRAYSVGQVVRDLTVKGALVGTVTALDPFGYIVEFSATRKVFMPEWNLAPAPHHTRTTAPAGWVVSDLSAGRQDKGGRTLNRASSAVCSCGWSQACGSRTEAHTAARTHKATA